MYKRIQKYRKGSAYSPRGLSRYPELGLKGRLTKHFTGEEGWLPQSRHSGSVHRGPGPGRAQHVWGVMSGGDDD